MNFVSLVPVHQCLGSLISQICTLHQTISVYDLFEALAYVKVLAMWYNQQYGVLGGLTVWCTWGLLDKCVTVIESIPFIYKIRNLQCCFVEGNL